MTLEDIVEDIHGLDQRLRELERQYGLLSEDTYALYRLGELEQSRDLIRWIGYYELRQERQKAYAIALREHLLRLRQETAGTPFQLRPALTPA
ncbi:MAG: hypothetical protein KKD28_13500 [Chloroflexi bacterium]|nr:hypothetical protein [Chloroflexota bacterium]MBU1662476.1 hypothetical protein [Chloroflexota bacterium]